MNLTAVIAAAFLIAGVTGASAKWKARYADSLLHNWFAQQFNAAGDWCCDIGDGHRYLGDYRFTKSGGIELENGIRFGPKVLVSKAQVAMHAKKNGQAITPRPAGLGAIIWTSRGCYGDGPDFGNYQYICCFDPGALM